MIDRMKAPIGAKKQESMKKYSAPIAAIAALSAALASASCADDREFSAPGTGANTTTSGQGGAAGEAGNGSGAEGGQGGQAGEGGGVTCEDFKENCGGTCVNLAIDVNNCGECSNACAYPSNICDDGECVNQCNGTTTMDCCKNTETCEQAHSCTPVMDDEKNCGGCLIECDPDKNCTNGNCVNN